ncbi:MAG: FHA domain-containing protein [Lentisphaeria bacterium]|jgi:hypothetical protein|nr:FHA domain-containing protein [Lentisphaeria bacterium]MDP7741191.1 FHA domain-containing protein [Lentisphaeria bacterium]|tara:strand:+ start:110 stop:553 length:444 start_codon:yes stop_codon:yes gene_type:complete
MSNDFEQLLVTAYRRTRASDQLEDNSRRLRKTRQLLLNHPPPPEPGAYVLVVQGEASPYWLSLHNGATVGRSDDAAIKVTGKWVSGVHCRFEADGTDWVVVDQDSTNGLQVNDHPRARHILSEGDAIQVGSCLLIFLQVRKNETTVD